MKDHSTNYFNTLIEVADDCSAECGTPPEVKGKNTVAERQFALLSEAPYRYTSDDVLFQVFAERNDIAPSEYPEARRIFFSKGQPCFRASPLTKTYGFGVHSDGDGKIALYGRETEDYHRLVEDNRVRKVKAMKTRR